MPISPSPTEVLRRNQEAAQRLSADVSKAKTLEILKTAQLGLERRLRTAEGLGGPGKGSFTAVQMRSTLAQVKAVLVPLQNGMKGVVLEQGKRAAEQAADGAARYLHTAERKFRGLGSQSLPLNTVALVDRAVAGTESSVLSRLLSGPHEGKKAGILQRYGQNVVGHFEDILQQRLVQKTPWEEVKAQLVEKSPFLQEAPAHWAERIVRTEVANQAGRASQESIVAADETLGDMCKILSSEFDSRTGADSYAVHGQIRRPSESFDSWFGSFMHPPDRPNDRGIVVPHRVSWPIPAELKPKGAGAVASRWSAEGRKGGPPGMPLYSTIPIEQFGKAQPTAMGGENPGSQASEQAPARAQVPADLDRPTIRTEIEQSPQPLVQNAGNLLRSFDDPDSYGMFVRRALRDQITAVLPSTAVSKDAMREGGTTFEVTRTAEQDGAVVSAQHVADGTIIVAPEVAASARRALEMLADGSGYGEEFASIKGGPGSAEVDPSLVEQVKGLRSVMSLIHEEVHGFSRMTPSSYRDEVGRVLEEAGTELTARRIAFGLKPEIAAAEDALDGKLVFTKGGDAPFTNVASYQGEIRALKKIIADEAGVAEKQAQRMIVDAHVKGVLSEGPQIQTGDEHLHAFTEALAVEPDVRARIKDKITTEFAKRKVRL